MGARNTDAIDWHDDEQDEALLADTEDFDDEDEGSDDDNDSTDNVGMSSVQFDVEELVRELESEAGAGVDRSGRLRKRLDAILERKRRHQALMDFDDYDLDS